MKLDRRTVLKLALISIAAVVVGAGVGLGLNYKTLKDLQKPPEVSSVPTAPTEEKKEEKIATYSGKIKPSIRPEIAAHYLEGDEGEIIVFLKSGKIESGFLGMLEGQTVEVVGKLLRGLPAGGQGDQEILKVDEVHL